MVKQMIQMAEIQLTDVEIAAAVEVLRSGALRQGKECDFFEKEFVKKTGAEFAVSCSSGTAAIHLAYLAFLKPGDEVLVPSFTFFATASMVTMAGGKPIFCDVDPNTFLIDLKDAESRISSRTRAIAPVHLFGNACDIEAVQKFANQHDLFTVWDAAQAHGAQFNGQDIGAFGDFVCYSFYPSKNMFVGEGGMACTNNQEFAYNMRYIRSHGQTGKYFHTMLGFNYRMTDVEAAIGREQLKRLGKMLNVRRRNGNLLNQGLADIDGIRLPKITPNTTHAWHQYCVVVDQEIFGIDRQTLIAKLGEKGIATGVHYPRGLHQQPVFEKMYGKSCLPNTEYLANHIIALPVHHGLSEDEIQYIVESIRALPRQKSKI